MTTPFIMGDQRFFNNLPGHDYELTYVVSCTNKDGYDQVIALAEMYEIATQFKRYFIDKHKDDDYWDMSTISIEPVPLFKVAEVA